MKGPDDIENENLNLLGWIPKFNGGHKKKGPNSKDFIVATEPHSIHSEAFKAIRTRIQYSILEHNYKTILLTSTAPQDGKTTISVNIGGSFALINKKVIILDCDLRIPKIHTFFHDKISPGLTDFLIGRTTLDKIVKRTSVKNLYYISSGTIPPNPSEIIASPKMRSLLKKLEVEFDLVIVDSPPIMSVTDSEILSQLSDLNLLVVSANKTEVDWLRESVHLLRRNNNTYLGVILNRFNYKSSYRSYYKYYQNYAKSRGDKRKAV